MNEKQIGQEFFIRFFSLIVAAKLFHYRTKKYSTHKTIDDFFEKFIDLSDKFLEVWQGEHNTRITFEKCNLSIPIITDQNCQEKLNEQLIFLEQNLPKLENCSDMLNIRDEMMSLIKNTKYLLTFS